MTDPAAPLRDLLGRIDAWNTSAASLAAEVARHQKLRGDVIAAGKSLGMGTNQLRAMMPLDRLKPAGEVEEPEAASDAGGQGPT